MQMFGLVLVQSVMAIHIILLHANYLPIKMHFVCICCYSTCMGHLNMSVHARPSYHRCVQSFRSVPIIVSVSAYVSVFVVVYKISQSTVVLGVYGSTRSWPIMHVHSN